MIKKFGYITFKHYNGCVVHTFIRPTYHWHILKMCNSYNITFCKLNQTSFLACSMNGLFNRNDSLSQRLKPTATYSSLYSSFYKPKHSKIKENLPNCSKLFSNYAPLHASFKRVISITLLFHNLIWIGTIKLYLNARWNI